MPVQKLELWALDRGNMVYILMMIVYFYKCISITKLSFSGLPSMIYLTFNKTLHQESLRQMGLKKVTRSVTGTMRAWT